MRGAPILLKRTGTEVPILLFLAVSEAVAFAGLAFVK